MAEAFYSRAQIKQWQENLVAISHQPRTSFTKKQAVEALIDTIERALDTRSFEEVATGLKEWGLDISSGSLKQYVSRYRRQLKAEGASRKRSGHGKRIDGKKSDEKGAAKAKKSSALERTQQANKQQVNKQQANKQQTAKLPEPVAIPGLQGDPFEQLQQRLNR